jgi:predicted HAD superfamily Cof-like phosphohydrolase
MFQEEKQMKDFLEKIKKFNEMYKVESNDAFVNLGAERIKQFHSILTEEINEAHEIDVTKRNVEVATELADLLGDLIVYCASEARRWGIPLEGVLNIIMDSNFSKLGADGKPLYDERGKIMKGPGYWKPEPKIKDLLIAEELQRAGSAPMDRDGIEALQGFKDFSSKMIEEALNKANKEVSHAYEGKVNFKISLFGNNKLEQWLRKTEVKLLQEEDLSYSLTNQNIVCYLDPETNCVEEYLIEQDNVYVVIDQQKHHVGYKC